jgi:hypothetical protein
VNETPACDGGQSAERELLLQVRVLVEALAVGFREKLGVIK